MIANDPVRESRRGVFGRCSIDFDSAVGRMSGFMRKAILFCIAGGLGLGHAVAANAQAQGPGAMASPLAGAPRPQDIAAANRQTDSDYNTLAARGVAVNNMDKNGPKRRHPVPATAADIKSGAQVRDVKGVPIGTIASLGPNEVTADSDQTVIDTGHGKIGVPLSAFGKDDKGLLLSITAQTFNQLVAQANGGAKGTQSN